MIHTDFQKGFIKAQIVNFDDLVELGSEAAVKAAGKMRLEARTTSCRTATWWSSGSACSAGATIFA